MNLLTREDLLRKQELRTERVVLDDEGNFVFVRQMTARERDLFEMSITTIDGERPASGGKDQLKAAEDFRAKLAVMTICDEDGALLLEQKDCSVLSSNISAARMELIIEKAQELNRISKADREALVKNFEGGQAADSPSDSVSD